MPEGNNNKSLGLLALAGVLPYQAAVGEEYMNPKQLEHFRKILDAWRQQLREEVDRTKTHMADEAANFPDPVDRAAQEEEFSLELRARDRERTGDGVAQDEDAGHDAQDAHKELPSPGRVIHKHADQDKDTLDEPVQAQYPNQRQDGLDRVGQQQDADDDVQDAAQ